MADPGGGAEPGEADHAQAVATAEARLEIAWRSLSELFRTAPDVLPAWDAWRAANDALLARVRAEPVLMSAWRTWLLAEAELFRAEEAPRARTP